MQKNTSKNIFAKIESGLQRVRTQSAFMLSKHESLIIRTQSGFTLVELIVVITIVWILSTIGFVAYSGYLGGARDGNRIASLTKLSDSLQTYAASKSLPLPDNSVNISATGTILGYQGYVGENVLETIDFTNGGKDPKDESYYTYYLSKDRKKLQLLTFLEEQTAQNSTGIDKAFASDYSNRYPKTYGQSLGIVVDSTKTPVQEISSIQSAGELDIFSTNTSYTILYKDGESLTGDKTVLRGAIGWGGLVGYWNFDTLSGWVFKDYSKNNTSGSASGWLTTSTDGVMGNSANFDGIDDGYYTSVINDIWGNNAAPHTISAWIKFPSIPSCQYNSGCRQWVLLLWDAQTGTWVYSGTHHWLLGWSVAYEWIGSGQFWIWNGNNIKPPLSVNTWMHIASIYDGEDEYLYINGKLFKHEVHTTRDMNIKNSKLFLWRFRTDEFPYQWKLDELRIYNRALDSLEVANIYNAERKQAGL